MATFAPREEAGRIGRPLTSEEILAKAQRLKEEGNDLFKEGFYKRAIISYGKAIAHARGMPESSRIPDVTQLIDPSVDRPQGMDESLEKQSLALEIVSNVNIATCYLKLADANKAINYAEKALALDKKAVKPHLKIAEAHLLKRSLHDAMAAYSEAEKLLSSSSASASASEEKNTDAPPPTPPPSSQDTAALLATKKKILAFEKELKEGSREEKKCAKERLMKAFGSL